MTLWMSMLIGLTGAAAPPATSDAGDDAVIVDTRPAPLDIGESLHSWIDKLGHPRYAVRQEAQRALADLGPECLPELARRYHNEASREVRHGIQYAAELIFQHQQIKNREGFLGVRIVMDTTVSDPLTRQPTRGVAVAEVIAGLPAERGGLRAGDVVIGVDGQAVPNEPTPRGFQNMIGARRPGEVLALRILRPSETARAVTLTVGQREGKSYSGLEVKMAPLGLSLGPRISQVLPDSPAQAAGLQVNEIIDSIDGAGQAQLNTASALDDILRAAPFGSRITLNVRACWEMTLNVSVGARPSQLLDAPDKLQARAAFLSWWRQNVGEPLPAPPSPYRRPGPSQSGPSAPRDQGGSLLP